IERAIDIDLARRVVDVIVAADDQVDAHVEIVDDYGKVVGRRTIGAHDHQIVELAVGHLDGPAHAIAKQDRSGKRDAKANDRIDALGSLLEIAAVAVVARLYAGIHGALTQALQALFLAIAGIGLFVFEQAVNHFAVTRHALALVERTL